MTELAVRYRPPVFRLSVTNKYVHNNQMVFYTYTLYALLLKGNYDTIRCDGDINVRLIADETT